ncbi:MAG: peptide/nickel transport system substrate-binding protein [Actinomycetota bacterium]|nr:peptide/nickel transport system substrate-binding protein [Actinomycetota bacterium]
MNNNRILSVLALLMVIGLLSVACDGSAHRAPSRRATAGDIPGKPHFRPATKGGVMRLASVGDVDFMDPGQASSVMFTSTIGRATLRTLISYPESPELAKQIIPAPDLATALGDHNVANTRWTYHLRPGLEYGKGLGGVDVSGVTGHPVKTADIRYAIERLYNPAVGGGFPIYYDNIVGANRCRRAATYGCHISGIHTPNDSTIVFNLTQPTGDWDMRMALPATAPVPRKAASKYDNSKDSNYDSHVVSSGPYYVATYKPGRKIIMKRNTTWDPASDPIRKAYPDEIDWKQGFDPNVCNAEVASGHHDLTLDCPATGTELRKVSQLGTRFLNGPQPCTYYLFLDTKVKPFDNINVRRAVNLIINKNNLRRRTPGGAFSGALASSILPLGVLGHLGTALYDPFPSSANNGNVGAARALMKKAGYGGGYHKRLLFFAAPTDSTPGQISSVRADLKKIGIDKVTQGPSDLLPSPQYYQDPASRTGLGFASWCADLPSPDSFLTPLLYGPDLKARTNNNYSQVNDPELNSLIRKAQAADPAHASAAWTAANKRGTELAALVPIRWSFARVLVSARLRNAYYDQSLQNVDFVNAGVKGRGR